MKTAPTKSQKDKDNDRDKVAATAINKTSGRSSDKAVSTTQPALRKGLANRHIQLIALGGAIGTGLFYGSSESISLAGPSVILAYLLCGLIIFLVVHALGEMSVEDPRAGAFSYYASEYWSKRAGFVSGWNYWANYILVSMVELTVVGQFVAYWFPNIPAWASAAFFLVLVAGLNLLGVRAYGETEFWLAIIKVIAVLAMIAGGLVVIFMHLKGTGGSHASFAHLIDDGGFFPNGFLTSSHGQLTGFAMALTVVLFSFGGTELIGITAGETPHPRTTIPKAINGVIWRILIFYIGSMIVILSVIPWRQVGVPNANGVTISPFVQIFDSIGVRSAAGILNLVCLTAVISVYNSGLYANSRMLYSLARQGNAPRAFGKLSKHGVPYIGVLVSALITALSVVIVFAIPSQAFDYLMSITMAAAVINWTMIMITEYKFRKRWNRLHGPNSSDPKKLGFALPGKTVSTIVVIVFLVACCALMLLSSTHRIAVIMIPIWLGVLNLAYTLRQRIRNTSSQASSQGDQQ
jgi:AAT family amino acid transporter